MNRYKNITSPPVYWGDLMSKFQTHVKDKYVKYFLRNCYQVNATTPHWSLVNIGSGNGLVPRSLSPYDVTRPQWVNISIHVVSIHSLRPSGTILQHKSGSILAQVMACCLKAPSHYLNQSWLIIRLSHWNSLEDWIPVDEIYRYPILKGAVHSDLT